MASVDLGEMAASHWGFGVGTGPCLRGCGCGVPAGGAGEQKAACQGSSNSLGHRETDSLGAGRGARARARTPPAGVRWTLTGSPLGCHRAARAAGRHITAQEERALGPGAATPSSCSAPPAQPSALH